MIQSRLDRRQFRGHAKADLSGFSKPFVRRAPGLLRIALEALEADSTVAREIPDRLHVVTLPPAPR